MASFKLSWSEFTPFSITIPAIYASNSVTIHGVKSNTEGPPLLCLHGFPQTHHMWFKVAPFLAERFTVIATDLRGYGESSKPEDDGTHEVYSKRAMANDQVEVMKQLGYDKFYILSHDRGARVATRLTLDHPDVVIKIIVLDIAPSAHMPDV